MRPWAASQHWDKRSVSFDEKTKGGQDVLRVLKRLTSLTCVASFPKVQDSSTARTHGLSWHPILGDDKYG